MSVKNPVETLLQWAQQKPGQPWLYQSIDGVWKGYTWADAEAQVRSMATALRALDLPPGAAIAISGRNTAHWVLADMAISMAGYISVGLYPKQSPDHIRYILNHCEAKAVFVGPMIDLDEFMGALPEGIKTIGFPYPNLPICDHQWDDLVKAHEPFAGYQAPDPKAVISLIYTSGTTGNPKGVMVTTENLIFATQGMMKMMPAHGQERFFSYLPLAHAFERGAVELASIYLGAEIWFLEDLNKLAEQLKEVAPTRFFGVPLVFGRIQSGILKKLPQKKLSRLLRIPLVSGFIKKKLREGVGLQNARYLIAGAAPMPMSMLEWFESIGMPIMQGYGMTENNIYATVNLPHANRNGSVGRANPGADMRIAEDGEIQYKHAAVSPGYYKDPAKTAELFTEDGWLRTGDLGRIDEDGYLFITGRVKDIFKTLKGKYVAPAPIEGAMARNGDIDQLCFVGTGLKQPIMVVQLVPGNKPREQIEQGLIADMQDVNATLEPHEQIAKIYITKDAWTIDNNIMTPTMKVKRNEIEKHYLEKLHAIANDYATKVVWEA